MIRLKRSISLRLVDNNTKYIYYDGKLKSIQYKDMKLLSSFFISWSVRMWTNSSNGYILARK